MVLLNSIDTIESLASWFASDTESPLHEGEVQISWVGQAGFLIKSSEFSLGVDLYLSDYLRKKYKNSEFTHQRMMQSPIKPEELTSLDVLLCTHGHSDHMDPETLSSLYTGKNPPMPICVYPRYESKALDEAKVPRGKAIGLNENEELSISFSGILDKCSITAIPAAHEELCYDQWGNIKALGYIIDINGIRIYHSGDCIPYAGLRSTLTNFHIDIVMLPVNGRTKALSAKGVLGNFTVEEACSLAHEIGASFFIPNHFGMFDFNTIPEDKISMALSRAGWIDKKTAIIPKVNEVYTLQRTDVKEEKIL